MNNFTLQHDPDQATLVIILHSTFQFDSQDAEVLSTYVTNHVKRNEGQHPFIITDFRNLSIDTAQISIIVHQVTTKKKGSIIDQKAWNVFVGPEDLDPLVNLLTITFNGKRLIPLFPTMDEAFAWVEAFRKQKEAPT